MYIKTFIIVSLQEKYNLTVELLSVDKKYYIDFLSIVKNKW